MNQRPEHYNETMQFISELEQKGNAFIFKPDRALKSFENKASNEGELLYGLRASNKANGGVEAVFRGVDARSAVL